MTRHHVAILFYTLGILIFLSIFVLGNQIQEPIKASGLHNFIKEGGASAGVTFVMFAFAFPIGILAFVFAGLVKSHAGKSEYVKAFIVIHVLAAFLTVWPMIVGRNQGPSYFASGGVLLLLLIAGVCWYWARQRQQASAGDRRAIDIKGLSYFCFAMATWNSCGTGGMPAYAIYPELVVANNMGQFVTQQFKVTMLYLVLGWVFAFFHERLRAAG